MIFVTGDCHGDFRKFSTQVFPEQKEMSRDDCVIVCGDFGIWADDSSERYWLKWLEEKPFTVLFVDGNHENFDRLYGGEFPTVDFCGGKAHRIRSNVFHLMRGYVYEIEGKKFFTFGGAKSHDIDDGVLDEMDFPSREALLKKAKEMRKANKMFRINHLSWWELELPTESELEFGMQTLAQHGNEVDFIVTHCCPQSIASLCGFRDGDILTQYFNAIAETVKFKKWFFGHYHGDKQILCDYIMLYEQIVRIV
ncbi:MAG: metallophosphoesterase [Lachnospiraceae bacterium]|nr:metallophosphoesterase [Lachnospiraceae bacterium]